MKLSAYRSSKKINRGCLEASRVSLTLIYFYPPFLPKQGHEDLAGVSVGRYAPELFCLTPRARGATDLVSHSFVAPVVSISFVRWPSGRMLGSVTSHAAKLEGSFRSDVRAYACAF